MILVASLVAPSSAAAASCQFVLGFKQIHDRIPDIVGDCTDNQTTAPNGDTLQHTMRGMLAYSFGRMPWPEFTDGYRAWTYDGGSQLWVRLNTDPDWFQPSASSPSPVAAAVVPLTPPAAVPAPAAQPPMLDANASARAACIQATLRTLTQLASRGGASWAAVNPATLCNAQFPPSMVPAVSAIRSAGTASGHWIDSKSDDGSVIILEDRSVWMVDEADRVNTALWLPVDDVVITAASRCTYSMMVNTSEQQTACVQRLS